MLKQILLAGLLAVSFTLSGIVSAQNNKVPVVPVSQVKTLAKGVPEIAARSFLLVDFLSGQELVAYNQDARVDPASITKLMTAYIIYRDLAKGKVALDDKVLISKKAWSMEGSRMFVEVGKRVQLEKLLRGLIIQSGNDAAVALAEHTTGSESAFVGRMNKVAAELGMNDTHYQNVTGWPADNHYTSARDIIVLTKALINEFPERYKLYSEKSFTYNKIKQHNRNKLLFRDDSVDGVKTGYTDAAGYCLVASAKREGMRLISVVLGTESENARAENSQRLLEYGFRTFEVHKLYEANSVLDETRIWKGTKPKVPSGVREDVYVAVPRGRYNDMQGMIQLNKQINAPVRRGDSLGNIVFTDEGKIIKQMPLLALEDVPEGGLWRRMVDSVQQLFN